MKVPPAIPPMRLSLTFHGAIITIVISIAISSSRCSHVTALRSPPEDLVAAAASESAAISQQPSSPVVVVPAVPSKSVSSPSSRRIARQENFYNYRTDYDDDRSYSYFEGDTRGNYVSDFGLRTNRPSARVATNPFDMFGRGRSSTSSISASYDDRDRDHDRDRGGTTNIGRHQQNRVDFDEDYLLNDGESDGNGRSSGRDDYNYYDDYQEPQQQYEGEGRPETGRRGGLGRGRIRITSTGGGGGGGNGGWTGSSFLTTSQRPGDPSYSFGYSTFDQSRFEISDSYGNVYGFYSYVDDDGILRHVSYTAGADTGFVVNQNRLSNYRPPIPPPIRIRPTVPPSGGIPESPGAWEEEEEEEEQQQPLYPTRIPTRQPGGLGWPGRRRKPSVIVKIRRPVRPDAPAWTYFRPPNPGRYAPGRGPNSGSSSRPSSPLPPRRRRPGSRPTNFNPNEDDGSWVSDVDTSYPKDASYHFAYDAGDHNRNEYSDPWGNVRGSYSYIDPDGIRRTVHYSAGAVSGFKVLSASPSNMIARIHRDPMIPPALMKIRPKPSAFVYHLHPDGGWKPWEGTETNVINDSDDDSARSQSRSRAYKDNHRNNANDLVAESYQFQSQGDSLSTEDNNHTVIHQHHNHNDQQRQRQQQQLEPAVPSRSRPISELDAYALSNRRRGKSNRHHHRGWSSGRSLSQSQLVEGDPEFTTRSQHRQQHRPEYEQIYDQDIYNEGSQAPVDERIPKDEDDEFQLTSDTKYEALKSHGEDGKVTTVRSYKGGYGDKNPLLVMSESSTRPRESSHAEMMTMTTSRPISVARLMSMRMAKSKKMMKINNKANSDVAGGKGKDHSSSSSSTTSSSSSRSSRSRKVSKDRDTAAMMMQMMKMAKMEDQHNKNNGAMSNQHSSVSQSQSFRTSPDDDLIDDFQNQPLEVRKQAMRIMSQERRLAHYPKSYKDRQTDQQQQSMDMNMNMEMMDDNSGVRRPPLMMMSPKMNSRDRDPMMMMMMRRNMNT